MKWAIGKIKDQKGLLIVFVSEAGVVALPPKTLKASLVNGAVSSVSALLSASKSTLDLLDALGIVNFDLADAAESAAGGGLTGMAIGAAVGAAQDKAVEAAETAITNAVSSVLESALDAGNLSEADVLAALASGQPTLHVPADKLKRVSGKIVGMLTKSYELSVVEKGFWIFNTTHTLVFGKRMISRAEELPSAARAAA